MPGPLRVAYVSLQAVVDGQDTWAAVTEVIAGWEESGWTVDRYFPNYRGGAARGSFDRLAQIWSVQRRCIRQLGHYDVVYIRAHPLAWLVARAAARLGVPVVQESNGPYEDLFIAWPATRVARPLFESAQRWQYRAATAIVSVAVGLTAWLKREAGHDRVFTIGNGANVDVFSPDAPARLGLPERYAVFFGQFAAWQGIQTLLGAVRSPEWPQGVALVFVGDGAMRSEVEQAATELPEQVCWLGRLHYVEVAQVVAHAMASFVPLAAEGIDTLVHSPLKLYESMACGVPVVGSDVAGIAEVIAESRCGLVVAPGNAMALAGALTRLAENPALAAEMGARGRAAAVDRYSWRARSRQRAEVVERVAKTERG